MSIAEFPSNSSRGKNNSAEFERTPPQDVIAEQSVLGGMLLSKDAISIHPESNVNDILGSRGGRPIDF